LGVVDRFAVGGDQTGGVGAGGGRGDLLAEDGADRELRRVDRARHPAAGGLVHEGREDGVRAQVAVDGDRVGVQVEQAAAAADGDGQVAQVAEGEPAGDVAGARGEGDDAVPVRQAQGAAIGADGGTSHALKAVGDPFLHARYGG